MHKGAHVTLINTGTGIRATGISEESHLTLSSATFGKITSTTAPRIMQAGMKMILF